MRGSSRTSSALTVQELHWSVSSVSNLDCGASIYLVSTHDSSEEHNCVPEILYSSVTEGLGTSTIVTSPKSCDTSGAHQLRGVTFEIRMAVSMVRYPGPCPLTELSRQAPFVVLDFRLGATRARSAIISAGLGVDE